MTSDAIESYTVKKTSVKVSGCLIFAICIDKINILSDTGVCTHTNGWVHNGRKLSTNILVCVQDGSCTFRMLDREYHLTKNTYILVPQNTFYAPHTNDFCTFWVGHFDGVSVGEIPDDTVFSPLSISDKQQNILLFSETGPIDQILWSYIQTLSEETNYFDTNSQFRKNIAFLNVLNHICTTPAQNQDNRLAHDIRDYIIRHLNNDISLEALACHFNYTKQHLINVFRQSYSVTPTKFIIEKRLELAKFLLTETSWKICEISQKCGYEDANYFSRLFREKYTVSPQKYRTRL